MIVFISWNGDRSRAIAKALNEWLPQVIQSVRPFFSPKIEKGTAGLEKIRERLEESSFGIICLTPENRSSNWIHFEAGALSKLKDNSRLWTVLYELKPTDIEAPLSQFQHTAVTEDEIFALLESINLNTSGSLDPERLRSTFEMWWPILDEELKKVAAITIADSKEQANNSNDDDIRPTKEMIEEILEIVRGKSGSSTGDTNENMGTGILAQSMADLITTTQLREIQALSKDLGSTSNQMSMSLFKKPVNQLSRAGADFLMTYIRNLVLIREIRESTSEPD